MRIRTTLLAILAVALCLPAFAQKQAPPAPGTPKNFSLPEIRKFTLDNGLEVRMIHYGTIPKVSMLLAVDAGNANEAADQVWLADLLGKLMDEGTTTRSAEQVALEAARMGGSLETSVSATFTGIRADALSEFTPDMVRLVGDIVRNPLLPEAELPRLKADLQRQLSISKSQQQSLANEKFLATLYPNQSFGRVYPTPEMIGNFTLAQVRDFYGRNFGAANSRFYIAGVFDDAATEAAIRTAFGAWPAGKKLAPVVAAGKSGRTVEVVDRPGAVQSTIYIGLPAADPSSADWLPLQVTNAILGGSFGSRITSNIREQKGYTYSPRAVVTPFVHASHWAEIADVTTNVTGPALKEIIYEITRLRNEPPSEAELAGIKNYLAGTFVLQNSSRAGIINLLRFVDQQGLSDEYLKTYVQRIYSMTPADVQQIAKKYFDPEAMAIVVAGDVAQIKDQLTPYGLK